MNNGPKVYVPQEPLTSNGGNSSIRKRIDISPASAFGTIIYLSDWCNLDEVDPNELLFALRDKLKYYCDDDYLLMTGNPTLMVLTAMVAAERNEGRVNLLYWRREERRYIEVNIDMDSQPYLSN